MYCFHVLHHPVGNAVLSSTTQTLNSFCVTFMTSLPLTLLPLQNAPSKVERLLIGNKCDWETERVVESERGEQLAQSLNIPFMETSARTGHNIDEVRGQLMMPL